MGNLYGSGDPNGVVNGRPGWSFYDDTSGSLYFNTGSGYNTQWTLFSSGGVSAVNVPVGTVLGWHKDFANTPALVGEFVQCDGQVLDDEESVYHGQTIPNINGQALLLKGSGTSGTVDTGGSEDDVSVTGTPQEVSVRSSLYEPPTMTVVWIMRIK
jgi:hypothetical protein